MASISTVTLQKVYDIKADINSAQLALEAYALVFDKGAIPKADAAIVKMLATLGTVTGKA